MNENLSAVLERIQQQVEQRAPQGSSPALTQEWSQLLQQLLVEALPGLLESAPSLVLAAPPTSPQALAGLARAVRRWDEHTGFLPCPPNMLYLVSMLKQEGFALQYQPQAEALAPAQAA
ncbi:hypothetical protein [Hymenobacter sp. DG01]|uniref:hypothetical protein n=1 Tax=Hymenobacter sp. DG01 TaxID=2584940 RepID=UPI0011220603|nr:hypothetical protein [Hymenobacter sp. DG01]